jgi:cytochrome c-type biogenesis protein CcmH/NrfG
MARAAVKAKQAAKAKPKPHGRRGHAAGGNPNQDLFFMRIRRRQRWVFALLAVLFGLTFAFVGVGSGSNSGLDQLFQNLNFFHSSGKSVSSAQKEIQKKPSDPQGYRNLATAYESHGDTPNAIAALEQYTNIKSKDVAAWQELAGLEATEAQTYLTDYQNAYTNSQLAAPASSFLPTGKLATALGTDPIENAASTSAQTSVTDLQERTQLAYNAIVTSWQAVAKLQPKNANAWFQLGGAAQTSGDTQTAISAYKKYLVLSPGASSAAQIKQIIKQLGG